MSLAKTLASCLNPTKTNVVSYSLRRCLKTQTVIFAKDVGASKKKGVEVESDPHVLCTRLVGGNFMAEGEDPVLGPDEEYPDWLWDLKTSREPMKLEDFSQDDPKYWYLLKKMTLRHNLRLMKLKKF